MSKIPSYYYSEEWIKLRRAVLARDNYRCQYCGNEAHQADHVQPRNSGGSDSMSNLVACCAECNKIAGGTEFRNLKSKKKYIEEYRKGKGMKVDRRKRGNLFGRSRKA